MSLAFLTPAAQLAARSPLREELVRAGAVLEVRGGWELAVRFAEPAAEQLALRDSVAWADASALVKLELRGGPFTPGRATREDEGWLCPLTTTRALLLREDGRGARDDQTLDVSAQLGALRIAGPAARETIARFCALDLRPGVSPPGSFRPGSLARTPGAILVEAANRYLLLFGAAYSSYLWTVVSDAGAHLEGRPVGVDAMREQVAVGA